MQTLQPAWSHSSSPRRHGGAVIGAGFKRRPAMVVGPASIFLTATRTSAARLHQFPKKGVFATCASHPASPQRPFKIPPGVALSLPPTFRPARKSWLFPSHRTFSGSTASRFTDRDEASTGPGNPTAGVCPFLFRTWRASLTEHPWNSARGPHQSHRANLPEQRAEMLDIFQRARRVFERQMN